MNADDALLTVEQLSCTRGERILFSGLSFRVQSGEVLQILGSNGSGKTSLLRMIAGLLDVTEGTISRKEEDLFYLGHQSTIKETLTVAENLSFTAALMNFKVSSDVIELLGLTSLMDTPAVYLSAGQKRRLALAPLWMSSNKLWILDEPFTALDRATVNLLEQLFSQHINNGGSIILTSHQAIDTKNLNLHTLSIGQN
jgi:heme exporter protein A